MDDMNFLQNSQKYNRFANCIVLQDEDTLERFYQRINYFSRKTCADETLHGNREVFDRAFINWARTHRSGDLLNLLVAFEWQGAAEALGIGAVYLGVVQQKRLWHAELPTTLTTTECPVCLSSPKTAVLAPCGHRLCVACSATMLHGRCPICRAAVVSIVRKVYD
jgi:hypothetical protein